MFRKGLLSILLAVFVLMLSVLPAAAETSGYSDLRNHWAKSEIEKWSALSILQGANGAFRPNAPITRGEMAVILDRVMKYQEKTANAFKDLDANFYTDAVLKTNQAGILLGSGGLVRPKDRITREEAAVVIGRTMGIAANPAGTSFADMSQVSTWAKDYVAALATKEILKGSGGKFSPKAAITRAEVVKILDNAINRFYTTAGEYSDDVVGNVVVNSTGVTLKNMKISGNLIIAEGVGEGEVALDNVTVGGETIIRGGGPHSVNVTGSSNLGTVTITKRSNGTLSVKISSDANVSVIVLKNGTIQISGSVGTVHVDGKASISLVNASVDNLSISAAESTVNVGQGSNVADLVTEKNAKNAKITVSSGGVVDLLKTKGQTQVDNDGIIKNLEVSTDDVVVYGTYPVRTTVVDETVTHNPVDGEGNYIPLYTTNETSGSGSSSGTTKTTLTSPSITITAPVRNVASAAATTAAANYTVTSTTWKYGVDFGNSLASGAVFAENTIYKAIIVLDAASGYVWPASIQASDVTVANASVESVTLTNSNGTLTITTTAFGKTYGPYTGTEAGSPILSSKTATSVTLTAPVAVLGETFEYAVNATDTAPAEGWQDGLIFPGLTANTNYYFFARVKTTAGHGAGVASASLAVTTDKTAVVIQGNDQSVTYAGNTIDVTSLFQVTAGAGTPTYTLETGGTGSGSLSGTNLTVTAAGTFSIGLETAETSDHSAGAKATAVLTVDKASQTAPTGLYIMAGNVNSAINGLNTSIAYEYKKSTDSSYTAIPTGSGSVNIDNLADSSSITYEVRVKGDALYLPSTATQVVQSPVASYANGGDPIYYPTLASALTAANTANSGTVTLLVYATTGDATVNSNVILTIPSGKTLTVGSGTTLNVEGTLEIKGTVSLAGSITTASTTFIDLYGTGTLDFNNTGYGSILTLASGATFTFVDQGYGTIKFTTTSFSGCGFKMMTGSTIAVGIVGLTVDGSTTAALAGTSGNAIVNPWSELDIMGSAGWWSPNQNRLFLPAGGSGYTLDNISGSMITFKSVTP